MKILVLDDHPVFLKGVEYLLSSKIPQVEICSVENADDALSAIHNEAWDLLLLDINLPIRNGLDLLKDLKQELIPIPTLVMSADIHLDRIEQALDLGALGFIPKAQSGNEMLNAIFKVARKEKFLPIHISDQLNARRSQHAAHGITPRQTAVLKLIAEGLSNREIATQLNLTEYTVKSHVRSLFEALGCKNRTACVAEARLRGIVSS